MSAARHHFPGHGFSPEHQDLVEPAPGQKVLSRAELRVLCCAANGFTRSETGEALHIADSTVKTHREHIAEKMGCRFGQAPMLALKMGIIRLLSIALVSVQLGYSFAPNVDMIRPVRGGRAQVMRPVARFRREVA